MSIWRLSDVVFRSVLFITMTSALHASTKINTEYMYRLFPDPVAEILRVDLAQKRLDKANKNPEYMLEHWINLPIAPNMNFKKPVQLSIREAILLALRYNPNIQSAELDRIIQRYQLRLAKNAFESQYALAGTAVVTNSSYSDVGSAVTRSLLVTPEFSLKNKFGTEAALTMDNNLGVEGNYNPLLNFSLKQPLLRGFGRAANESSLLDSIDTDKLNGLGLRQLIMDQITQVIITYRALILSANNLQIQQRELAEAHKAYDINKKKIAAGQLEPTTNIQQSYQIESLSLMVEQAEQDARTTSQDLLQAIGLDPNVPLSIQSEGTVKNLAVPDVNESIKQALMGNLNYLTLKQVIYADERAWEAAKNQQLWQLDLTANIQAGTVTDVTGNHHGLRSIYSGNNINESAGVLLTIPLRDLNRRNILITAKIKLEKDRVNLIATKRALITKIKNIITILHSLVRRYKLSQRQVSLAAKSYELEKKKQQIGISSALDVTNTQNQWINAQMGLMDAKIAFLNQLAALHSLLGTTLTYWHIKLSTDPDGMNRVWP